MLNFLNPGFINTEDAKDINIDLIDLNAPKASHIFIKLAPPRLAYYSEDDTLNVISNVTKAITTDISFKQSDKKIDLGIAQDFRATIIRNQYPLEFLSSSQLTFLSNATTRGQGTLINLVVPKNIIIKLRELDVKYSGINAELINAVKSLGNLLLKNISPKRTILYNVEELSEIPFGLIIEYKNKVNEGPIAKYFIEMCKITSLSTGVRAGDALLFESLNFVFHRIIDF